MVLYLHSQIRLYGVVLSLKHRDNFTFTFTTSDTKFIRVSVRFIVSVAQSGWTTGVHFPVRAVKGYFSLHHRVQTGSEAHPTSYSPGIGVCCPGGKAAGA
jgi:hypothetical protein